MKSDLQERGSPKNSSDALGWFLLLICLGALVGSFGVLADGAPKASSGKILKVMSYNIHHGEGIDRRLDLERIAAVIADSGADIVALQELDQSTRRTGGVAQTEVLAHHLGMHHQFAKALHFQGGAYGLAVLVGGPSCGIAFTPCPIAWARSLALRWRPGLRRVRGARSYTWWMSIFVT